MSGRRGVLAGIACAALATGAMAWLLGSRWGELATALDRLPIGVFALATGLHLLVLVVRAEAWSVTLAATSGRGAPRPTLHAACAGGYLAGSIEIHASLPVRMAVMRRLAPDAAPSVRGMVLSDMPLLAVEVVLACLIGLVAAAAIPGLPWWVAPLALLAALAMVLGLRLTHERLGRHRLLGGLAVLGTERLRGSLAALGTAITVLTLARVGIVAAGCGVAIDAPRLALLYIAIGALGLLPVGPASVPGATLAVAGGSAGVGAAGAAGLAIAASTIAAVLIYVVVVALLVAAGARYAASSSRTSPSTRAAMSSRTERTSSTGRPLGSDRSQSR